MYTQTILYYKGPQQHGTSVTNITDCDVIAEYTATLTNMQYSLVVNCHAASQRNCAKKVLSVTADEDCNSRILVAPEKGIEKWNLVDEKYCSFENCQASTAKPPNLIPRQYFHLYGILV